MAFPPLIQQILFGGGLGNPNTPPFVPGNPGSGAPPIAPPTNTRQAPAGFFDKADAFLQNPFIMNLLAQEGTSPTPTGGPLGAIGRASLMTAQQKQQRELNDVQRQLIESRIGLNRAQAAQGGNPTGGNVQSVFRTADGKLGIVRRDGTVDITEHEMDQSFQTSTLPSGAVVAVNRRDPNQVVPVVDQQTAVAGAAARKGAEAQASTAAQESTKQQFQLPQRIQAANQRIREIDSVMEEAHRALGLVGPFSTGGVGGILSNIPYTDAFKLKEAIKPIQAALSFDRLQAMRDASPTGGALGQVSERELDLLGAALVSLNQAQEPGDVKRALTKVLTHYENWKAIIEQQAASMEQQQAGDVSGFKIVDPNAGN